MVHSCFHGQSLHSFSSSTSHTLTESLISLVDMEGAGPTTMLMNDTSLEQIFKLSLTECCSLSLSLSGIYLPYSEKSVS